MRTSFAVGSCFNCFITLLPSPQIINKNGFPPELSQVQFPLHVCSSLQSECSCGLIYGSSLKWNTQTLTLPYLFQSPDGWQSISLSQLFNLVSYQPTGIYEENGLLLLQRCPNLPLGVIRAFQMFFTEAL